MIKLPSQKYTERGTRATSWILGEGHAMPEMPAMMSPK